MADNKHHPVTQLASAPREHEVISTKNGNVYSLKDDGGAITRDGFHPHPFRQSLMRKAVLLNKGTDVPAFVVKSPIAPMFAGDPLARFPVLTPTIQKAIDANIAEAKEKLEDNKARALAEAKLLGASEFVASIVEKAVKEALAGAAASKKEAKA